MSSVPSRLAAFLCANNIPHPNGTSRCPAKPTTPAHKRKCKKKKHKRSAESAKKKKRCKKHKKRH